MTTSARTGPGSRGRVVLVAACAQRKRLPVAPNLSLSSLSGTLEQRSRTWRKRLRCARAPLLAATDMYVGDHWNAVLEAYRLTCMYSSRTELWVMSAGYGLISGNRKVNSYGATFASGNPDSVWRGIGDGDRTTGLRSWWHNLDHDASLKELLAGNGTLLITGGAAYLTAIEEDLNQALLASVDDEAVSVISAGKRGNGFLLPVTGELRGFVGGTDSSLNARALRLIAATAEDHHFRKSAMTKVLTRIASSTTPTLRQQGHAASNEVVARTIRRLRDKHPRISRRQALRELRSAGTACEQRRFAAIWTSVVAEDET